MEIETQYLFDSLEEAAENYRFERPVKNSCDFVSQGTRGDSGCHSPSVFEVKLGGFSKVYCLQHAGRVLDRIDEERDMIESLEVSQKECDYDHCGLLKVNFGFGYSDPVIVRDFHSLTFTDGQYCKSHAMLLTRSKKHNLEDGFQKEDFIE